MPNKWTFQIKPIAKLLKEEMNGGLWIDPYAGKNSPATTTNDINPKNNTDFNLNASDFLNLYKDNSVDGVLFDPPYSLGQIKEHYRQAERTPESAMFNAKYLSQQKHQVSRIIKPGGKIIHCGWYSNGIGKGRGFKLERILLVAHGGQHHDTIVTVERKMNGSLF